MSDLPSSPISPVAVRGDLAAGSSAGESASLYTDTGKKRLESKLHRASPEKNFLFAGDCIFIETVHGRGKSGSIAK